MLGWKLHVISLGRGNETLKQLLTGYLPQHTRTSVVPALGNGERFDLEVLLGRTGWAA